MKDIYLFWLGGEAPSKIKIWKEKYKTLNFIVGPSAEDHLFLMENFVYYKNSFELGKFAFCSDVWRAYKLSNSDGLYIDTSVVLGPEFAKFVDKYYEDGPVVFKETYNGLANCIFFGPIGTKVIDVYKSLIKDPRYYQIGPDIFSILNQENIKKMSFIEIRNKNTIFKIGSGSWMESKPKNLNHWDNLELKWRENKPPVSIVAPADQISIWRMRAVFDNSTSKIEIRETKAQYKVLLSQGKVSLFQRLIWSKLYRFFTGKWLKTK